jgi:hypothetical protein
VIRETHPQVATIEKVFVNVNPQSTLLLGQARGAAICAAVTEGLVVHEYAALQIKQAVVGFGQADKRQVQTMVQRLLGLDRAPDRCGRRAGRDLPWPATLLAARRVAARLGRKRLEYASRLGFASGPNDQHRRPSRGRIRPRSSMSMASVMKSACR